MITTATTATTATLLIHPIKINQISETEYGMTITGGEVDQIMNTINDPNVVYGIHSDKIKLNDVKIKKLRVRDGKYTGVVSTRKEEQE